MDVFFEFISTHLFNGEDYVVDDFAFLNETDLLESLNYYIKRNKVTAKVTAKAYIGNLRKFFAVLENQYNVHSDIFVNGDFLPSLLEKTNQIVSLLNDKENSNIASDEKYSEFLQKIEEIQSKYSYLEAIKEIDNYVKTKTIPNHFRWIISDREEQLAEEKSVYQAFGEFMERENIPENMEKFEKYKIRMGYNEEKLKSVRYRMSVYDDFLKEYDYRKKVKGMQRTEQKQKTNGLD